MNRLFGSFLESTVIKFLVVNTEINILRSIAGCKGIQVDKLKNVFLKILFRKNKQLWVVHFTD